jgi:hypothetical protein
MDEVLEILSFEELRFGAAPGANKPDAAQAALGTIMPRSLCRGTLMCTECIRSAYFYGPCMHTVPTSSIVELGECITAQEYL